MITKDVDSLGYLALHNSLSAGSSLRSHLWKATSPGYDMHDIVMRLAITCFRSPFKYYTVCAFMIA